MLLRWDSAGWLGLLFVSTARYTVLYMERDSLIQLEAWISALDHCGVRTHELRNE